ncbi:MAG: DNA polymerase I [Spirochaetaceae bacterium]|jgi:DNA polymerase-1|nr:DNA polymerase I [Spirochaetaceae bacterium]
MARFDQGSRLPPLYLVDSYALIYRSYFAFMTRPLRNGRGENVSALFGFAKTLVNLLDGECTIRKACLAAVFDSRKPTFRHKIYGAYKANRQKAPEDLHSQVPRVEEFLGRLGIRVLRVDGYEADDIIATLAMRCRAENRECRIFSSDKDLLQLVGNGVYALRQSKTTQKEVFELIGPDEVKSEWGVEPGGILDLLSLSGDASDNIPGVHGIGEKTAVKLLQRYGSLDAIFQNITEIGGSLEKKLSEGRESAYLSKKLISLAHDIPLEITSIDEFLLDKLDRAAAADFLIDEGIPSIARVISDSNEIDSRTAANIQNGYTSASNTPSELLGEGVYSVVNSLDELSAIIARAREQGFMALDFETDSLDAWNSHAVGISLATKSKEGFYVPLVKHAGEGPALDSETVRGIFSELLADPDFCVIAHNAKYDYAVSRAWGVPRWKAKIFDTMIGMWLCDSDRSSFSLDSLAFSYFNYSAVAYNKIVPKGKIFADIPLDEACRYSSEDADLCIRLFELLSARLAALGVKDLFTNIEMPLIPVLAEMEGFGIKIEASALKKYGGELAIELQKLEAETWSAVGHTFNLASPKQLQEVLFVERALKPLKKTKTGWSTDMMVLEELAGEDRVPELILQHRTLTKLKSTYVDTLAAMADKNARIHTSFIQTGTTTGRLSSRDPNLQNIPVRDEGGRRIREAFIAADGCSLISADYSQIELVILAHLSQDKNLISAFHEGKDVHTRTAALIFGVDEAAVDAAQRRVAKIINFGVMYGMSAFRLSSELKIGRREASSFIETYFKTYSGVKAYMDAQVAATEKNGFVTTLYGRRRAIPAINSVNKTEKAAAERVAINTPIQGTAADIVKKAMIDIDAALIERRAVWKGGIPRLLLQVHDELIFECAEADTAQTAALVRSVMENTVALSLPLRVSVETGKRWGEFH